VHPWQPLPRCARRKSLWSYLSSATGYFLTCMAWAQPKRPFLEVVLNRVAVGTRNVSVAISQAATALLSNGLRSGCAVVLQNAEMYAFS